MSVKLSALNNSLNDQVRDALKQTVLPLCTRVVSSNSIKSIFASVVIGSLSVVTHSNNTTIEYCVSTLIDSVLKQQKESNRITFYLNGVTRLFALIYFA